jgi:DNA-binding transcriptional ArsR family regulator
MKDFSDLAQNTQSAVTLLKALANQHRLMVLCCLTQGELSVNEINNLVPITQSSLSQHLAWLRKAEFVKTRRESQNIFYSLNSEEVKSMIDVLHQLYCAVDNNDTK